jgi:hypothetical protein
VRFVIKSHCLEPINNRMMKIDVTVILLLSMSDDTFPFKFDWTVSESGLDDIIDKDARCYTRIRGLILSETCVQRRGVARQVSCVRGVT